MPSQYLKTIVTHCRNKFLKTAKDRDEDDLRKKKKRAPRENKARDEDSDEDGGWEPVKKGSAMPLVCSLIQKSVMN